MKTPAAQWRRADSYNPTHMATTPSTMGNLIHKTDTQTQYAELPLHHKQVSTQTIPKAHQSITITHSYRSHTPRG